MHDAQWELVQRRGWPEVERWSSGVSGDKNKRRKLAEFVNFVARTLVALAYRPGILIRARARARTFGTTRHGELHAHRGTAFALTQPRRNDAQCHIHASIIIFYPDGGRYDLPLNRTMAKLGYANVEAGN